MGGQFCVDLTNAPPSHYYTQEYDCFNSGFALGCILEGIEENSLVRVELDVANGDFPNRTLGFAQGVHFQLVIG